LLLAEIKLKAAQTCPLILMQSQVSSIPLVLDAIKKSAVFYHVS